MYEIHIPNWMEDSHITSTRRLKEAREEAQRLTVEYNDGKQYIGPSAYVIINRVYSFRLFGWGIAISKKVRNL